MAFGSIMRLKTSSGLNIELAPFTREEAELFVEGFQKASVTRFLGNDIAQTRETEQAWYDAIQQDKLARIWGIWVVEKHSRKLIGNTSIEKVEMNNMPRATTGIVITDKNYWGKGIATATHKARSLYAFERMRIVRLMSYIYDGNEPSLRALEKVGYNLHHRTRNEMYNQGEWLAVNVMECINPLDWAWSLWWGNDRVPRKNLDACKAAAASLEWARHNVEML